MVGVLDVPKKDAKPNNPPIIAQITAAALPIGAQPKTPPDKGKPTSTRLLALHANQLSELAREEDLEGGAAEAFDKHFAALLHNKLIAAKAARLKRLQDEASD